MNYFLSVMSNFAQFNGRARRAEFWYFVLFNFLIGMVLGFVEGFTGTSPWISLGYNLVVLIPSIAVSVRRMHDVGKSGWFLLIPIYSLILACTAGDQGENEYGHDPKAVEVAA